MKAAAIILALTTSMLVGCGASDSEQVVKTDKAQPGGLTPLQQVTWIRVGKESVQSKLKDGASAKFQNVFFNQGKDGVPVSCGQVNSKNGFGAYGGYQRYIATSRAELTFLEEQMTDFQVAWDQFCT